MADYSGYYQCAECGAGGTYRDPAVHKDWCSAPEKIARRKRERALEEQRAEQKRIETMAEWDDLSDDALVASLKLVSDRAGDLHLQWRELEEFRRLGAMVVNNRGLMSEYLEHSRTVNARRAERDGD